MDSQPVNLSNKNAFAGANLGVPCSPMEAVTSLDPKDYVWTNPLSRWQIPPHPFQPGIASLSGGLLTSPGIAPAAAPFFPGFGGFPWAGLQNFCLPSLSSAPPLACAPPSSDRMKGIGESSLQHGNPPMVPVEVSSLTHRKSVDKAVPTRGTEVCPQMNTSDILQCYMEDDDLKYLLEDPLDAAFEGLASDSSNASCLTSETSSPGVVHVGLDDGLLSLTDLPFPCIKSTGERNGKAGVSKTADSGRRKKLLTDSPAHWGVKKKRSTRKSKIDWKSVQGSSLLDPKFNEVALIELDEMLWGIESRSIPTASSCLITDSKMVQDQLESGLPSVQLTNA